MPNPTHDSSPSLPRQLAEALDRAEHDILRDQCPTVYALVAAAVAAGKSNALIKLFFSRAPGMYPALIRRIEATAEHVRRARHGNTLTYQSTARQGRP